MMIEDIYVLVALPLAMGSLIYGPTGNVMYFLLCCASFLVTLIMLSIYAHFENEEHKRKYGSGGGGVDFAKGIVGGFMTLGAIASVVVFVICMTIGLLVHKKK